MQSLSTEEIQLISETIDRSEISFSHLRDDLIDHVCCEIEQQMEQGIEFTQAFESIKNTIGIKSLQQVQEKTLLLIDKNYCVMKTTMKLSGIISIVLLMVGTLFKIQHWPFAGIMLTLGFFGLCFIFLPSAYYIMHKENRDKSLIMVFISAFIGSFGFLLGILFKIQHWPGGGNLLTIGVILLCVLFFPLLLRYLFKKAQSKQEKAAFTLAVFSGMLFFAGFLFKIMHWPGGSIVQIAAAVFIIGLFVPYYSLIRYSKSRHIEISFIYLIAAISWVTMVGMLLSLSKSKSVETAMESGQYQIEAQNNKIRAQNEKLYELKVNSSQGEKLEKTRKAASELNSYVQQLKIDIIHQLDAENYDAILQNGDINPALLKDDMNTNAPASILFTEGNTGKAQELKQKIETTLMLYIKLTDNDAGLVPVLESCLNTKVPAEIADRFPSWEALYFEHVSVIGSMEVLTAIQRNLHLAEQELINYLQNS